MGKRLTHASDAPPTGSSVIPFEETKALKELTREAPAPDLAAARLEDLVSARFRAVRKLIKDRRSGAFIRLLLLGLYLLLAAGSAHASPGIADILGDHLRQNYPWAEVEVRDVEVQGVVPKEVPERILVLKGPPRKTVFRMEYADGRSLEATADVKVFDWVLMARRAFRKGYVLQKGDVYATLMDAGLIPKDAVRGSDVALGKTLMRSIVANRPITSSMVSDAQPVKRGQKVILLVESRDFSITAAGETKENGHVGDFVKVMNMNSKKVVTGVLVDENTVRVEF